MAASSVCVPLERPAALAINTVVFLAEIAAGVAAGSALFQANAIDSLGNAANDASELRGQPAPTPVSDLVSAT